MKATAILKTTIVSFTLATSALANTYGSVEPIVKRLPEGAPNGVRSGSRSTSFSPPVVAMRQIVASASTKVAWDVEIRMGLDVWSSAI
jgi:hypothetical protein